MPKWLVYSTASMLMWALWSLLSPVASRDLSGSAVQMLSSIGLVPVALLLLFSPRLRKGADFRRGVPLALATGILAGIGNILVYNALANHGPASLVFPIVSVAPLVLVVAAPFLFHEKIRPVQAGGIGLALAAIALLNTTPSASAQAARVSFLSTWMLDTLLCLMAFGLTFITQKAATYFLSDELCTVFYTAGFLLLDVGLFAAEPSLTWKVPALAGWASVLMGVLVGIGSLTLFAAYRHGKASTVTPYSQLFPIITVLVAAPLYHEPIDALRGTGIAAALAAGVMLTLERP